MEPVPHYRIAPRKVSRGRQFTGKNPPARQPSRRDGFLPVNCQLWETFSGGGRRFYNGKTFMGPATYDLDCSKEIAVRMAKIIANLKALDKIWKSKTITLETKLSILKTCVFSTMLYGCETWTVTKRCESRILSFERKCYRRILRIGWTQKVTNEEL